jgi:hypothetical protein
MDPQPATGPLPSAPQADTADLSAKTVTTLVLVTLIVSFLGAWMNVHQASTFAAENGATAEAADSSGSTTAQVNFRITGPERVSATGLVAFNIAPPNTATP